MRGKDQDDVFGWSCTYMLQDYKWLELNTDAYWWPNGY